LRRIDGVLASVGGGVDAGANPYRVATSVTSRVVAGRPAAPMRGDGVAHWTFARERALDAAGVDRAAVAHPVGAAAFAALPPCDGTALAGGDRCAVAAGVDLDDDSRIARIRLVAGGVVDTAQHRADLVSGASMGLGMALSEQVPLRDDVPTPATIRSLGLLRCGQTPPFDVDFVATEPTADGMADGTAASPQHDVYALAATVAAVAAAVRSRGDDPVTLPMTDSAPAAVLRRR
jgi:CO/xanthine dehydrogenase Mo-binding subunit